MPSRECTSCTRGKPTHPGFWVSQLGVSSKTDAQVIFRDAAEFNMTDAGYAWIVTEQALEANNVPEGILGLRLVNATNEKAHIKDSM
jgi:hypothetical protein